MEACRGQVLMADYVFSAGSRVDCRLNKAENHTQLLLRLLQRNAMHNNKKIRN